MTLCQKIPNYIDTGFFAYIRTKYSPQYIVSESFAKNLDFIYFWRSYNKEISSILENWSNTTTALFDFFYNYISSEWDKIYNQYKSDFILLGDYNETRKLDSNKTDNSTLSNTVIDTGTTDGNTAQNIFGYNSETEVPNTTGTTSTSAKNNRTQNSTDNNSKTEKTTEQITRIHDNIIKSVEEFNTYLQKNNFFEALFQSLDKFLTINTWI